MTSDRLRFDTHADPERIHEAFRTWGLVIFEDFASASDLHALRSAVDDYRNALDRGDIIDSFDGESCRSSASQALPDTASGT